MVRWEVTVRAFNRRRVDERSFIMVVFVVVDENVLMVQPTREVT